MPSARPHNWLTSLCAGNKNRSGVLSVHRDGKVKFPSHVFPLRYHHLHTTETAINLCCLTLCARRLLIIQRIMAYTGEMITKCPLRTIGLLEDRPATACCVCYKWVKAAHILASHWQSDIVMHTHTYVVYFKRSSSYFYTKYLLLGCHGHS